MATTSKSFAYARVSTKEQHLDRQIDSLKKYVQDPERDIYCDKVSGHKFDRPEWLALKRALRPGDVLYIHELDRLGRNKTELLEELRYLKQQGVTVRILNIPTTMLDETALGSSELQKSILSFVNDTIIQLLSIMAENERTTLLKRQHEGLQSAKRKGVKLGRPETRRPKTWFQDVQDWKAGKITAVSLYRDKYHMSKSTFYKLVTETLKEEQLQEERDKALRDKALTS